LEIRPSICEEPSELSAMPPWQAGAGSFVELVNGYPGFSHGALGCSERGLHDIVYEVMAEDLDRAWWGNYRR
jgi:hypothetical protein